MCISCRCIGFGRAPEITKSRTRMLLHHFKVDDYRYLEFWDLEGAPYVLACLTVGLCAFPQLCVFHSWAIFISEALISLCLFHTQTDTHRHWNQEMLKKENLTMTVDNFSFISAKNLVFIVNSVYRTPAKHRTTPNWALGNYKERKGHNSFLWRVCSLMGRTRWQIPLFRD